jgi:hypothetical protein
MPPNSGPIAEEKYSKKHVDKFVRLGTSITVMQSRALLIQLSISRSNTKQIIEITSFSLIIFEFSRLGVVVFACDRIPATGASATIFVAPWRTPPPGDGTKLFQLNNIWAQFHVEILGPAKMSGKRSF